MLQRFTARNAQGKHDLLCLEAMEVFFLLLGTILKSLFVKLEFVAIRHSILFTSQIILESFPISILCALLVMLVLKLVNLYAKWDF